jgi:hypothetical protein
MLDELRHDIQTRLDELLGEADKLRRARAALGSRDGTAPPSGAAAASPAPEPPSSRPLGLGIPCSDPQARAATPERQHSRQRPFTRGPAIRSKRYRSGGRPMREVGSQLQ